MLSLRNNLSFGFGSQVEMLSRKHNAGYAAEDCVVAFLRSWGFCIYPQEKIGVGKLVALLA